ncbi:AER454Cp [Eremothecium gossypii ATCC 10895]|uniref:triacylglycerol lipase n=1 Tax=Eremothecium gossypii (strain ATCC 10895 / CBS 109.51 / FGSC 9923 / NRRL Y-1056) TaxID=284811 RepID=Q755R4_EREGS|nr:AER454Cp [Eremothecium gossypii ATCC 10895]AAS53133.1 AER454Cp [Eremothecium gossypii ATCC 10895]
MFKFLLLLLPFFLHVHSFSDEMFDTLKYVSYLTNSVYCVNTLILTDPFHDGKWYMEQQGLNVVKVFDPDMTRGQFSCYSMIAINDTAKQISIIFRGSVTIQDWIVDFIFPGVPYQPLSGAGKCTGDCFVHSGVYEQFKLAYNDIYSAFKPVHDAHPDYEVIITGHSLGGGYAYLMAIELQLLGYKPLVVTYGGMRIGGADVNKWIDGLFNSEEVAKRVRNNESPRNAFYRVVQEFDIVPLVPPGPAYTHAGVQFTIRDDSSFWAPKSAVTFEGANPPLREIITNILLSGRMLDLLRAGSHVKYFRRLAIPCFQDSVSIDGTGR